MSDAADIDIAFRDWTVADATEEQQIAYLRKLCSDAVPNSYVQHREILRGITLNHLQMARTIISLEATVAALNSENDKVAKRVLWLTFICAGGTIAQVIIALCR